MYNHDQRSHVTISDDEIHALYKYLIKSSAGVAMVEFRNFKTLSLQFQPCHTVFGEFACALLHGT